jgi:predicted kinase
MPNWREIGWWDLPGPSRFIERAASALLVGDQGVLGLVLPEPSPDGLLDALALRISESFGLIPMRVDASAGLRGRSPVHKLAAVAGVAATAVRSVAEFVDAPGLANTVFFVEQVPPDEWMTWGMFLRGQRFERARRPRAMSPAVCLVVPNSVMPDDIKAALGGHSMRWVGVASRLDSQMYAEQATGFGSDDLESCTALSTITEVAAWDPSLIRALAALPVETQLDPRETLARVEVPSRAMQPCWANRLVDHWDGHVVIHVTALLAAGDVVSLARRIWRGHVRTIFPFIEQIRHAYASRYEDELRAQLPIEKTYHSTVRTYADPFTLELYDLFRLLKDLLSASERTLLHDCYKLRTSMAHMEPAESFRISRASQLWDQLAGEFPDGCWGWDWPRCGQRLVLMIGPSGGGKTTWAGRHFEAADVVSSDQIREEIFGSVDARGDQEPVFRRLRRDVVARLSSGRTAVVDATNLRKHERLANALIAPLDMPVDYVVVDRPMDEKVAMAGWRAKRPGLLQSHAVLFEGGLREILAKDGLSNVRLVDERTCVAEAGENRPASGD